MAEKHSHHDDPKDAPSQFVVALQLFDLRLVDGLLKDVHTLLDPLKYEVLLGDAAIGLVLETGADGVRNILAVDIAAICDVVDRDARVQVNSDVPLSLLVTHKKFVVRVLLAKLVKRSIVALLYNVLVDSKLVHLIVRAPEVLENARVLIDRAILPEVDHVVKRLFHNYCLVEGVLVQHHVDTLVEQTVLNEGLARTAVQQSLLFEVVSDWSNWTV